MSRAKRRPPTRVATVGDLKRFLLGQPDELPIEGEYADNVAAYVDEIIAGRDRRLALRFRELGAEEELDQ